MCKQRIFAALVLPFLLLSWQTTLQGNGESFQIASELEDKIISQRLRVERWQASVHSQFGGTQGPQRSVVGVDTYVDGNRLRCDVHYLYDEGVQRPDPDRHTYKVIESCSDEFVYEFSSRGKVGLYGTPLVEKLRSDLRHPVTFEKIIAYDPRAIGNSPSGTLSSAYSVVGTLRQPGRLSVIIDDDLLDDGTSCKKVTADYGDRGKITYWVSPAEGYSIRRHRYDAPEDSPVPGFRISTEITVAEWKDSGIWLPTATSYERYENDELVLSEEAQIEFISVNEPLDESLFLPISFGIEPGTNAYRYPNPTHARYLWDGEKITFRDVRPVTEETAEDRSYGTMLLLINSIIFAVIACVFLVKATRRSSTP